MLWGRVIEGIMETNTLGISHCRLRGESDPYLVQGTLHDKNTHFSDDGQLAQLGKVSFRGHEEKIEVVRKMRFSPGGVGAGFNSLPERGS